MSILFFVFTFSFCEYFPHTLRIAVPFIDVQETLRRRRHRPDIDALQALRNQVHDVGRIEEYRWRIFGDGIEERAVRFLSLCGIRLRPCIAAVAEDTPAV